MDEHVERRQDLPDGLHWWRWVLIPAQIDDDPRDIAEKRDGDLWVDEAQQGLHHTQVDDVIPEDGAVADNVAQSPHGLVEKWEMSASEW